MAANSYREKVVKTKCLMRSIHWPSCDKYENSCVEAPTIFRGPFLCVFAMKNQLSILPSSLRVIIQGCNK